MASAPAPAPVDAELERYLHTLCPREQLQDRAESGWAEELRATPLISWPVRAVANCTSSAVSDFPVDTDIFSPAVCFRQYAVLGRELPSRPRLESLDETNAAVFFYTDAPWSAFLCGS